MREQLQNGFFKLQNVVDLNDGVGLFGTVHGIGKIEHVRADNDGIAHAGRFHKVLTAVRNQRTADEYQRRQVIPDADFADGVGDINVGLGGYRLAFGAQRRGQAEVVEVLLNFGTAIGVARRHNCQQSGNFFLNAF